ncbi:IS3 family transposase [Thermosulfidibacter takaii]|uniref:IS3 family transposase n=1 Tax=Thermosulfidibacter takaii TaxID=412593 RepID=UPI0022B236BD|nr:IS3 family transposase [Thermosulfidibacter takaii]
MTASFEKDPSIESRRMTALLKEKGYRISRKKVAQLMKELNLRSYISQTENHHMASDIP